MSDKIAEQGPSEKQRLASKSFEAHMAKFMAKQKENTRLDNEARAKARGPMPAQPSLTELQKQHEGMKQRHQQLGGSNWQYSDRDQNMTPGEHEARKLESSMRDVQRQMRQAKPEGGYAKGGKISLKDCSVSTASKGKSNCDW